MSQAITEVDDGNFAAVVGRSTVPVIVDFWAQWCPPCIAMARTLEELAPKYAGRVLMVKCNVEVAIETATEFGVRGLPHVGVVVAGKAVDTRLGFQSRAALEKLVAAHAPPKAT